MALHTHQTLNGDTTAFKCYRSVRDGHSCVYVEIFEGYTTPGWANGKARRTTTLRLTKRALTDLAEYFTQLADQAEGDESLQNAALRDWAKDENRRHP